MLVRREHKAAYLADLYAADALLAKHVGPRVAMRRDLHALMDVVERWKTYGEGSTMYLDDSVAQLVVFERRVAWMYLDTAGYVTVDVGLMLPTAAAAAALPFVCGDRPATTDEIRGDWARVKSMTAGRLPGHYVAGSSPRLPAEVGAKLLRERVAKLDADLSAAMKGYAGAPDAAKLALLDMGYECGVEGVAHRFPHLDGDVAADGWMQCAKDCRRGACSDARNAWTAAKFEEAAKAV